MDTYIIIGLVLHILSADVKLIIKTMFVIFLAGCLVSVVVPPQLYYPSSLRNTFGCFGSSSCWDSNEQYFHTMLQKQSLSDMCV